MVFAIAVNEVTKARRRNGSLPLRPVYLLSWLAVLLLTVFSATKVVAEYHAYMGERSETFGDAQHHFEAAVTADPEYAGAYLSNGYRTAADGDPAEAAQLIGKAIGHGLAISPIYSQLAKQHIAAGNFAEAEAAYREALSIYPRSVYMRTEFAVFLEDQGRTAAAAEQSTIARSIDPRQAKGWYMIIREGSVAAFYRSRNDADIAAPAELIPTSAVRKYLDDMPGARFTE